VPPLTGATRSAIEEGCLAAAAGFIDRTINQLTRRLNGRPVLFVTGGASAAVIERLRSACKPCDDLVLRGVATIAEVPIRRRA
jgi:pantothenate kinase type III